VAGTGQEVVSPEALKEKPPDLVIIMNAIYREEVSRKLAEMALTPEVMSVY